MKLSDYKGEKAIEVFADLLEPISEILSDAEIRSLFEKDGTPRLVLVSKLLKKHSSSVHRMLAILNGNPEEYEANLLTLPITLIEILNDKAFTDLFISQSQGEMNAFGSAMENTEVSEI